MEERPSPFGSSINGRTAMIVGGTAQRIADLNRLLAVTGCTALAMDDAQRADFLLRISQYLQAHRSTALVWTKMGGLEDAYAALPQGQCHFLVDADDIEAMPILAGAFGRGDMDRLHHRNRDVSFESLHRISDELAEFARTLARMARFGTRSIGFRQSDFLSARAIGRVSGISIHQPRKLGRDRRPNPA